jgi:hypothetical protein
MPGGVRHHAEVADGILMTPPVCSYEVGADLRLIAVDEGWSRFATENDAPELQPPRPLGRSIFDAIADSTTKLLYRELFERVRTRRQSIGFTIRCDSPRLRRRLGLTIARLPAGFRVETVLQGQEPNPGGQWLARGLARNPRLLVRSCSWCKKVEVGDRWCELDEAIRALKLFEEQDVPTLTHAMCPSCYERINATLTE